jgi:hypothetical protein
VPVKGIMWESKLMLSFVPLRSTASSLTNDPSGQLLLSSSVALDVKIDPVISQGTAAHFDLLASIRTNSYIYQSPVTAVMARATPKPASLNMDRRDKRVLDYQRYQAIVHRFSVLSKIY